MTIAKCIKQKNKLNNADDKADFDKQYKEFLDADIPAQDAFTQAAEVMMEQILEERNELAADVREAGGYLADISLEQLLAPETKENKELDTKAEMGEKIEDFGDVLHGANKHSYVLSKEALDDIDSTTSPLSKSFPKPDNAQLEKEGVPKQVIAAVNFLRKTLGSKPRSKYKIKAWVERMEAIRGLAFDLIDQKITPAEAKVEKKEVRNTLGDVRIRQELPLKEFMSVLPLADDINAVDIDRLTDFVLQKNHYSLYHGEKNVTKFDVSDGSKKSGNNRLGNVTHFDSEQEALDFIKSQVDLGVDKQGKRKTKFDFWTERGKKGTFLGKKIAARKFIELRHFDTSKEARDYLENNTELLETELKEKRKKKTFRRIENNPRVGEDYRQGKLVTKKLFEDAFGFRGVQFGNWVEGSRRQQDLNNAYDGLRDLAQIIGVPTQAISLNGTLGLAFGARGRGGKNPASAHYEPDSKNINLTKKMGSGSLAHEWWHSLDNYFSDIEGEGTYQTERKRPTRVSDMKDGMPTYRASQSDDFGVRQEVHDAFMEIRHVIEKETDIVSRSIELDNTRGQDYWSTVREMTARSFETYVISKLKESDYSSDYLANVVPEPKNKEAQKDYPYVLETEQATINKAFDKLFETIEIKEDDVGNVAMFSLAPLKLQEKIISFVKKAVTIRDRKISLPIGIVTEAQIKMVAAETKGKIDLKGYRREWDNYGVIHAMNMHSNKATENPRGQVAITPEIFPLAIDVIENPDSVKLLGGINKNNNQVIEYKKKLADGTVIYAEEVKTGKGKKKLLNISSLRIQRPRTSDALNESPEFNAQDDTLSLKKSIGNNQKKSITIVETHAILDDLAPLLNSNIGRTRSVSDVVVVPNFAALPNAIKQEAQKQGSDGSDIVGVFHKGKIYLIQTKMANRKTVEKTLYHEATHKGLKEILGDKKTAYAMNKLMMAVGGSKRFNQLADDLGIDLSAYEEGTNQKHEDGSYKFTKSQREQILIEELLAHIGERGSKGLKQKALDLLGALRNWLRKMGLFKLAELGASDLSFIAKSAREHGLKNKGAKRDDIRFMFEKMANPKKASVVTRGGVEFDVSFSKEPSPWMAELQKLAELEEPIILEGDAPQNDGIDYEAEKSLFLSTIPKGTVYRADTTRTAQAIRAASNLAAKQLGKASGNERKSRNSIGKLTSYISVSKAVSLGDYEALHIEFYASEQYAEDKADSPALTVIVEKDGELTIHGPAISSDAFKWLEKEGLASEALDANGEPAFGGLDLQGFTRLNGVTRKQLIQILGDVHARTKAWKGRDKVGLKWKRSTGAKGGTEQDGSAIFFSRETPNKPKLEKNPSKLSKAIHGLLTGKASNFVKRNVWGLLKPRQIAEQLKRILPNIEAVYLKDINRMEAVKNQYKHEAGDIAAVRKKLSEKDNDTLSYMQHEATIAGVDPDVDYLAIIAPLEGQRQINVLYEKMRGRPGANKSKMMQEVSDIKMQLGQEMNRKKAAPSMSDLWAELNEEQKNIYRLERDFHVSMRDAQQAALLDRIAESEVDEAVRKKLMDSLEKQFGFNNVEEPYFPLARFGEFWVHAKIDGGSTYDMFETLGEWEAFQVKVKAEGGEVLGAGKTPNEFNGKESGLNAEFVSEVVGLISELGGDPKLEELSDKVYQLYLQALPALSARKHTIHRKKTKGFHHDHLRAFAGAASHGANLLGRLTYEHKLRRTLDDSQKSVDMASSKPLYQKIELEIADYRSFLEDAIGLTIRDIRTKINAFKKAKNEEEAQRWDRYRVLQKQTGSTAKVKLSEKDQIQSIIKRIEYRETQLEAADLIIDQNKQTVTADALAELRASHEFAMNPNTSPIAAFLNALGFVYFLGATPAAALVNMMGTPTIAFPLIGARFGFKNATKELAKATADFYRNGKMSKEFVKTGRFSIEHALKTEGEVKAFKWFHDVGLLDKTLVQDLQGVNDNGINTGQFKYKLLGAFAYMFHRAESANREITAIAAYRAGINKGLTHEKAMEAAEYLTWKSHFDYGSHNRARFMRGNTARVVTQFKQYSQEVSYLHISMFKEALKNSGATKEERIEAKNALMAMYAMQFSVAGSLGLFGASAIIFIAEMLSDWDEDEPEEAKANYRAFLADKFGNKGGRIVAKGFVDGLTPIALQGRLTMGDLWIRTSDRELEGARNEIDAIKALGGPMVSIGLGFMKGFELVGEGKVERGIEQMVPKVIKDAIKANRYRREDAKTMSGLDIKEMSGAEIFLKAIGFASSDLSDQYDQNNAIGNISKKRNDRRSNLIDRMIQAREKGDTDTQRALRRDITRWNMKNPSNKINARTLTRSSRSKERFRKQYIGGLRQTKQNRDLLNRFNFAN